MIDIFRRLKGLTALPAAALAVTAAVTLWGYSQDECLENGNSLPLAGFFSSTDTPEAITIDSLTIFGLGAPGDSILHDSVRSLDESYLPFRIDTPETTFVIRYLQGDLGRYHIADTITFRYDICPNFVSAACGVVYDYRMTEITTTHNVIDSVTCPSGIITNEDSQNLRIYFRVAEEGD